MMNNGGNAEVMGVVLLIAVFIGAITLVGVSIFQAPQPQKVPAVAFDFWADENHTNLSLVHRGGETLNLSGSQLKVIYSDGSSTENPAVGINGGTVRPWSEVAASATYGIGSAINLTTDRRVDQVQLIWPGTGAASMTGGGGAVLLGAWSPNGSSGMNPPAPVTGVVPITFPYPSEQPVPQQTMTPAPLDVYFIANVTATNGTPILFTDLTENRTGYPLRIWNFSDIDTRVGDYNPSIVHTYATPVSYPYYTNYTVTLYRAPDGASSVDGQPNMTRPHYITAYMAPTAQFTPVPTEGNAPFNVSFIDSSTGYVDRWTWDYGDGEIGHTPGTSWHIYTTAGEYSVTLTAADPYEADSQDYQYIRVHQPLVPDFGESPNPGIANQPVQFADRSTGDSIYNWDWDFGDGTTSKDQNATHVYTLPGTYNVSLKVTNPWGSNTTTKAFTVTAPPLSPPVANFTATPENGTAPLAVTFTDTSTNTPTAWNWSFGDGSYSASQNPPQHTYTTPGAYTVTLTAGNAAGNSTATKTVLVYSSQNTIRVNCGGGDYTDALGKLWLADRQYSPGLWGYTPAEAPVYSMDVPIGNTSDPILYQTSRWSTTGTVDYRFYLPNGDYTVQLKFAETDTNATNSTRRTFDVTVNNAVVANNFNIYTTAGLNTATDLYWTGTVTDNQIHIVLNSPTGGQPMIAAIGIAPASTAVSPDFTGTPQIGNANLTVNFTDKTAGTGINGWFWDYGDGNTSTLQNPQHTYTTPGSYTVTLTAGNANQSRTIVKQDYITVGPTLTAGFTANTTVGIAPLAVTFTDTSTGNWISNWSWSFGDGATSSDQNPQHTYAAPGVYTVTLTVANPYGSASATRTITVHSMTPDFTANKTIGNALFPVQFTDTTSSDLVIDGWTWDFGDGVTASARNPQHTYTTPGIRDVTLTVTNSTTGLANTTTKHAYITVLRPLLPNFTANTTEGNTPLSVQFSDTTTGDQLIAWNWNFGDGNTSTQQNPQHTYTAPGSYSVTLTAGNAYGNGTVTRTGYITVHPPLIAAFGGAPLLGNAPLNVSFADQSSGYNLTGWDWNFGDGTTTSTQSPHHLYTSPGTYTVTLTVTNPYGTASISKPAFVTVLPQLVANFTANRTAGNAQLPVQFTDTSLGTGINGWSWDFGDNTTASTQNPAHTYATAGTYTVTLTASNSYGNNTTTRTGYITVLQPPVANFNGTPTVGNGQTNVQFTDLSTGDGISSRTWTFGDGSTATAQNPTHLYTTAGSYNVTLTVSNAYGSSTFTRTRYITVYPPLVANFTATPTTGQVPLVVDFTDASTGYNIIGWTWDFGDGSQKASLQNVSHTYTTAGTYTVTLTVTNPVGTAQTTKTITATAPVTTPTPAGAAIYGTIYNDQNGDGSPDTTDPKLAGWTITLLQNDVVIATTTSDASGAYAFYDLQNGKKYYVAEVLPVGWQGTNPAGGTSAEIHITGNDQVTANFWNYYKPETAGGTFNLNAAKEASLLAGRYLQFRDTVSYSDTGVTIGGTFHHVNAGDTVRLYVESSGSANIQASSGGIWGFTVPDVTLSINGVVIQRGAVTKVSINGYDSLTSTLAVTVPSQNAWTSFTVNGAQVIPGQSDSRIINLYNVTFTPSGTINLQLDPTLTSVYIDASAGSYQLLP